MEKHGTLEWVERGKVVRKEFAAIVIEYPSGVITTPHYFKGRMFLADDISEKPLLVLAKGTPASERGVIRRSRLWGFSRHIIEQRMGLVAWIILLCIVIYRNLSHFFGF
jgi:hypothetical protein